VKRSKRNAALSLAASVATATGVSAAPALSHTTAVTFTPRRATLASFAGTWYGHTRLLKITRTGLATESVNSGCCDHAITFKMRLSHPRGTTSVGSVLARVVAVRVFNPADFSKAFPPPKVGQTRRMTLRHGVIVDPFLRTTYCDMAADMKGYCGA
jgi:hypothetical protein